ncbi:oligosaccharide flippase family protein [Ectopseudomonas mendocina]|nr:oligosaccharide flippase family protein [Pseudomonas mendocina]TXR38922.1 oligosaccharide flippase family protein [Pseudomonas mendocina]
MLESIKFFFKSKFVRNIAVVAMGTAGAQAITMAFVPVITRLYGPEAFGLFGTFIATLSVLTPIAALTYPIAIALPKSDEEAKALARLSFKIAISIAALLFLFFLNAANYVAELLNLQAIAGFMILIPFVMLFSALQQIGQQWLFRKKQYKANARVALSQSLIINSAKAIVGFFYASGVVLIFLATLGNAIYALQLWYAAKKNDAVRVETSASVNLIVLAKKYSDFPFYRAPQVFVNAISQSLPILILAGFFGPSAAGFFSLAKSVLMAPAFLVGKSVGDVFYPSASRMISDGKCPRKFLLKSTFGLALAGCPIVLLMLIFGEIIFRFFFGEEWAVAGSYSKWISIWLYFFMISRPLIAIIPALSIQDKFLVYEIFSLVAKAVISVIAIFVLKTDLGFVVAYSLLSAALYVPLFLFVLSIIRIKGLNE